MHYQRVEEKITTKNIKFKYLFNNSYFYIDEFVGFTKQELEIIKKLLLKL